MKLSILLLPLSIGLVVATAAAEPLTMALKFTAGEVQKITIAMDASQMVTGDGLPAPQQQATKMTLDMTLKVVATDKSGSIIEMT